MDEKRGGNKVSGPLVSICITFFNAGRYIHRAIESCLNQSYRNIELIIVDDASTDNSEQIIKGYLARDPRIKYFRNDTRIRLAESEMKMFRLAAGEFTIMLGADDWLARDYVENGLRSFSKHPDAAGIVPDLMTLIEDGDSGVFKLARGKHFSPGIFSAGWFAKRMYRPKHLYISALAMVRTEDLVSAFEYYFETYYKDRSGYFPEELKEFFTRAFGMDVTTFLKILANYKNFVFDDSLNYIKITHSQNQYFDLKKNTLYEILKDSYYYYLIYKRIYRSEWSKFFVGMKIFVLAQTFSTIIAGFFRGRFRLSFLNMKESKKMAHLFFSDFSPIETVLAVIYSFPMVICRGTSFLVRKLKKGYIYKNNDLSLFSEKNFLDSNKRFFSS